MITSKLPLIQFSQVYPKGSKQNVRLHLTKTAGLEVKNRKLFILPARPISQN